MKKIIIIITFIIFLVTVMVLTLCSHQKNNKLNAPSSWFENPTTESPSDITPFTNVNVSDTAFHFWSWQKFLSLTRTNQTKAPFENLVQVDNYGNKIGSTIILNDTTQAGSGAVLYDKTNHPIYYTIHFNIKMYNFQQKYQPLFAEIINKFKQEKNADILIQTELNKIGFDTINFPVSSYILKTSWILASSLPSTEGYYVTNGQTSNDTTKTVKIALTGMHIIGRVYNHPEFIWATYEHKGLAPNYSWDDYGYPKLNQIISDSDYVFYTKKTNFNNCIMMNGQSQFNSVFNIYPYGMVRSFIGTHYPSKSDIKNNENIVSLDKSVNKYLIEEKSVWSNYFYKGSVWLDAKNSNFGPGNSSIGNLTNPSLKGARAISNITMETYTQLFSNGIYTGGSMNCFGCHNTVDFDNPIKNGDAFSYNLCISHAFRNGVKERTSK